MTCYSIHGGHNRIVQGANWGDRKEHIMDRQVKDAVAAKLRALGHTVYDDMDETGLHNHKIYQISFGTVTRMTLTLLSRFI